ncbi:two-component system, OmpR family, aerobic respiration control sensor histidine kinase ArcB [Salipiger thiooxidans]|uniref:histidine kinase n=1 Tax=Salipiger thiooxidans TaxID=282683 RepID=A0A1G7EGA2_9RHOB|nr:ATP-binding protein [Salipiger thiooxidans]SDE62688.1 two-component system, OmpR family, aerobic respiration control sensor histidine kinase ArcB [Salipiger thiooxidans]
MPQSTDRLSEILRNESDALVKETVRLALEAGFTDQTSSMRAAWTEATERLNDCIVAYLCDPLRHGRLDGRHDYRSDKRFNALREIAWRHHDAGVTLELNHGLFKLYRRVYLDRLGPLLRAEDAASGAGPADAPPLEERLECFFDEADQAMLTPWAVTGAGDAALGDSVRRLTRERDQYFGVIESLRGPVFIVGEDGALVNANQAALQSFLGLSEAGGLTYRLALQPHRRELQAMVDRILGIPTDDRSAVWLRTDDGSRCFDIRVRDVEDTVHKLDRWQIILMHDVTEHLRAVERARDAENTMSLFLAAMSHEIRGPLHCVLGAAELLEGSDPGETDRLVELIGVSARGLNATLENVLNFSRFEHQSPQPRPEPVAIADALASFVRMQEILARQQGVPLGLELVPDEIPGEIQLDWSMTQQVLGNLVRNALRHDDGRGVTVRLWADADALCFRIDDHGPGLPEEIRQMLASGVAELRPRATGREGSGLGLAIAQRMTNALGGRITALDTAAGASVEVRLPLVPAATAARPPMPSAHGGQFEASCLVVDDDPIGGLVTGAMLERLGLTVDHAGDLGQARALCAAHPDAYDCFIVDYRLSDGTGSDFARSVRLDPALRGKPVLLLSANVGLIRDRPEEAEMFTAVLEKPLDAAALAQAIRIRTRPAAGKALLDGLSPSVQRRMAEAFAESWSEFLAMLSRETSTVRDPVVAGRAHKLANGAMTFGLTELAEALRALEHAHETETPEASALETARAQVLRHTLAPDWPDCVVKDPQ